MIETATVLASCACLPLPHRGNYTGNYMRISLWVLYDTVSRQRQFYQYRLPHRGNYTCSYMRISLWVFCDTVPRQRQLYQYRYQREAIIPAITRGTPCGSSSMIPFPDKGSCINTVTRQRQFFFFSLYSSTLVP